MNVKPIVKWAGGKRQLLDKLINLMPKQFNNYYEPFVGGGAFLFSIMPEKAIINDVNKELIAIYQCLTNEEDYQLMLNELINHENSHSEEHYYEVREEDRNPYFNQETLPIRAARAIYLNKSCFNGLYRVNSKGYFNVPSGKKKTVHTFEEANISKLHEYFKSGKVTILNVDFEKAVEDASKGDFVYFDPPYDSYDEKTSFTSYTVDCFTRDDQIRLAEVFKKLSDKGVYVMLSNHNTKLINQLYSEFHIHVVDATRMINANSQGRGAVEEVIITNY